MISVKENALKEGKRMILETRESMTSSSLIIQQQQSFRIRRVRDSEGLGDRKGRMMSIPPIISTNEMTARMMSDVCHTPCEILHVCLLIYSLFLPKEHTMIAMTELKTSQMQRIML